MSEERTHFRCHAFGLLPVAICQANRRRPLGVRTPRISGDVRPFSCRGCAQAAGVDEGTEPTRATVAEIERSLRQPPVDPPPWEGAVEPPENAMPKETKPTGLVLTRKAGQMVTIGEDILVTVIEIKGRRVRLHFHAPASYEIYRKEVRERIEAERKGGLLALARRTVRRARRTVQRAQRTVHATAPARAPERPASLKDTTPDGDVASLTRALGRLRL